ncbi:hypothetical protein, partial [Streptomyces griseus]|uniref:hypothetical protein n=1 Tax=Streptomyces griseus TaxID=1911 RepID=UPI0019403F7B
MRTAWPIRAMGATSYPVPRPRRPSRASSPFPVGAAFAAEVDNPASAGGGAGSAAKGTSPVPPRVSAPLRTAVAARVAP